MRSRLTDNGNHVSLSRRNVNDPNNPNKSGNLDAERSARMADRHLPAAQRFFAEQSAKAMSVGPDRSIPGSEAAPDAGRQISGCGSGLPKKCDSKTAAPEGADRVVGSGSELAHIVDVHVVGVAAKAALGYLGGFGHAVSLDFVGLHFVVEVFYIDLEQTERGAVGAAGLAAIVVESFERGEERGLNCSCHDFEVLRG